MHHLLLHHLLINHPLIFSISNTIYPKNKIAETINYSNFSLAFHANFHFKPLQKRHRTIDLPKQKVTKANHKIVEMPEIRRKWKVLKRTTTMGVAG